MNITFLGATKTVTGSNFLVEGAGKKFLVDCGLFQGQAADELENEAEFQFNTDEIDFMLLTHVIYPAMPEAWRSSNEPL